MKFAYGLPVIIFGAVNIMMLHQVAVASQSEVNAIAQKITVRISGPKPGSGVIVDKQGNTYTVLTNWHVVDTAGTYTIQPQNGGSYQIKSSQVKRLSGVDLAFFQFQSNQTYETANIANSEQVIPGTTVYAAGWAEPNAACKQRCFLNPPGNLSLRLDNANAKDGYTWIYTNNVKPGMSGGPVLDDQGRLVGINGRGIPDARTGATDFLAIPINTYVNLAPISPGISFKEAKTLTGRTGRVTSVAFSPDGKILASGNKNGNENGRIQIWDVATGKLIKTLTGHSSWVNSVAFSPDGRTLASGSNNGGSEDDKIKIWDVATGKLLKGITDVLGPVNSIAFSPDGRTLASGISNNTKNIKIWDVATGKLLTTLTSNTQEVYSVAFSPDGKTLASGSYDRSIENSEKTMDNSIKIWDVATGEQLKNLTGHGYVVTSVVFSPNGKTLASGSADNTIKIWDTGTGKLLKTLTGHKDSVFSVAFSPDGRTLVSGSGTMEGTIKPSIKIWDVGTGKILKTLEGHDDSVLSVAFSSDGRTLASGSRDESIKIWQMSGR